MSALGYLSTLPNFVLWLVVMGGIMAAYTLIYTRFVTPYDDLALIRAGNLAAALSLAGAKLGFVIVLVSVATNALSLVDLVIWAIVGLLVQIGAFYLAKILHGELVAEIEKGSVAAGIWLATFNLVAGAVQAACMVY